MKILIVDDDIVITKGLVNILNRMELEGLETLTCCNAIDALEVLKHCGADLLITDIDMPIMNGLELIKEAHARAFCTRFLILSGFEKFEYVREALRFHVLDYLLKPIDKNELMRIVGRLNDELHGCNREELVKIPGLPIYDIDKDENEIPCTLARILSYIRNHCRQNLSLEELGFQLDLHPNYICSLFQKYLGTTFLHYLDCLRLQKSVALLLNYPDMPVEKVAVISGFMNERQLYKVFKKRIGQTPGTFRKQYTNIRLRELEEAARDPARLNITAQSSHDIL